MKKRLKFIAVIVVFIIPFLIEAVIRIVVLLPFQWFLFGRTTIADTIKFGDIILSFDPDYQK